MATAQTRDYAAVWITRTTAALVGRTITAVRYLSTEEASDLGWYGRCVVLTLDDGTQIYPAADDEGNNAGALFTTLADLDTIPVVPT